MLLLMMLLTVSMGKSSELQELVAGNHREKARAFESAESALNYAEWWLNQGNATTGANCATITTTPVVCSNALANPTTLPWAAGVSYTPPNMTISTTGGVGSYYAIPMFYIQYLGASPNTGNNLYQITAHGNGGDAGSIAVIQSIFQF
jgi:type IV pilus assembly protein PilX